MNFDYLIFDVDGTLWDTTEIVARSWNYTLEKLRFERQPLTASDLKQEFGKPMDIIAADLFPQLPAAKGYVFSRLSSNHKLFIVSNCQSGYIELFLKKNNLRNYITDIECYGNTKKSKGENIRLLLNRHPSGTACYIGDTAGDYCASKEAGVPFIFASYGFGDVPEAQIRISHFSDLLTLFQ